jgi:iron complex outermembrane receptor protein
MYHLNKPVAAICLAVASAFVQAQQATYDFNIPAQPVSQVLDALAKQTGLQPFYAEGTVKVAQSPGVKGKLSLREALDKALAGTGLSYQFTAEKAVAIKAAADISKEQNEQSPVKLRNIVVSATKRELDVSDAPASVTVVTVSDMDKKNVTRLGDALNEVPSLYMRGGSIGGGTPGAYRSGLSLRGAPGTNKTLVMIDGQSVNDSYNGGVNWSSIFMDDVERVEVVPGSFSSLYGGNAIGGVINVITKAPDKRELKVKASYTGGDYEDKTVSFLYRNKFENGLGVVLGFGQQENGGYNNDFVVKAPSTGAATTPVTGWQQTTTNQGEARYLVGDKGDTPWQQRNMSAKVFYDLTPRSKFHTGFAYNEHKVGYSPFHTYLTNNAGMAVFSGANLNVNGVRVNLSETDFLSSTPSSEESKRYFAGYEGIINDDYKLKIDLAYTKRDYWYDLANTGATYSGGPGSITAAPNTTLDGMAQLSFPLGERQFITVGLSTKTEKMDRADHTLSNWRDPESKTVQTRRSSGNSSTNSLFLQDEITLHDHFTLYLGGRYDHWTTSGNSAQFSAPTFSNNYSSRSENAISPKVSGVYKPLQNLTLRASIGKSFRTPTNFDLYGDSKTTTTTTIADPTLKPETSISKEFGAEMGLSQLAKIKATYFENEFSNLIYSIDTYPSAGQTLRQKTNTGKAKVNGIELSGEWKAMSWLDLRFGYTYMDSKILSNNADPLSVGKRLTEVPKNSFSFGFDAHRGEWSGSFLARYLGKVFNDQQNRDTVENVFGAYDPYWLADAKISYEIKKDVKASFAINNIFDKSYYRYYLMPGRTMTLQISAGF